MYIRNHRDLLIWQKATALARDVYHVTRKFPAFERHGLAGQVQRAAVSVPSNIAEGQARQHTKEFRQFLFQALGSLAEVDTQLWLAHELHYLERAEAEGLEGRVLELRKMIHALISRLPKGRP